MKEIGFKIVRHIGTLKDGSYPLELNIVEWGNMRPKYDLRTWKQEGDKKIPCRGLTMSLGELRALRDILNDMEELEV